MAFTSALFRHPTAIVHDEIHNDEPLYLTRLMFTMIETIFDQNETQFSRRAAFNRLIHRMEWRNQTCTTKYFVELAATNNLDDINYQTQFLGHLNSNWNDIHKLVLLLVAFKRNDELLKERLRREFEKKIVTLAPVNNFGGNIVDRSWVRDNIEEIQVLPRNCSEFIMNVFLTARVENAGPVIAIDNIQRDGFPQMFAQLNSIVDMDLINPDRLAAINVMFRDQQLPPQEEQILRLVFRSYLLRPEDRAELMVLLQTPQLEINELFLLYVLTKFNLNFEEIKDQLQEYFVQCFTYNVPKSAAGCFINRGYLVEHRSEIELLPEEAQQFLVTVLIDTCTKRITFAREEIVNETAPGSFILNGDQARPTNPDFSDIESVASFNYESDVDDLMF